MAPLRAARSCLIGMFVANVSIKRGQSSKREATLNQLLPVLAT
jgi:hypothetical protein